jgi:hypothetical protein
MPRYGEAMAESQAHHPPGWFTLNVTNRIMIGLTKLGISVPGRVRSR